MEDFGKVSVVMPAYNSGRFITEAIASVLAQTYSNWELLIVDDASTDATAELLQNFRQDDRIKIFRFSENKGTQFSRNKAIEEASGDFIAFLDADDLWKPEKLYLQLQMMQTNKLPACFSSYELISENGQNLHTKIEALSLLSYQKLQKANYVGNLTGIYDVRQLGKVFAPDLKKRQDWALWLEVIRLGGAMYSIRESLAYYRVRKNSISGNKLEMLRYNYKVYHEILGFSKAKSLLKMCTFLWEQFFVKSRQQIRLD